MRSPTFGGEIRVKSLSSTKAPFQKGAFFFSKYKKGKVREKKKNVRYFFFEP
jgi:hypothetical protein